MHFTKIKLLITATAVLIVLIFIKFSIKRNSASYITLLEVEENKTLPIPNTSDQITEKLFGIDLHYILNNGNVCEKDSDILAVFIVTSYFGNTETRSAMRRAFSREDLKQLNLRRVFLLGEAPADKYVKQEAIEDENRKFKDIVQGSFLEAYRNLTYKHMMGLQWVANHCSNAKFVVKMDDDIVVNVERIPELLQSLPVPESGNYIAGYVLRNMLPVREPANKWYVTFREYEEETYPLFVSGWFYVTNPNTCKQLVALGKLTKYFWIDDTYVTGILAKKIKTQHFDISEYFTVHAEFLNCCIDDIRDKHLDCDILIGPNGGNNNLFYDFNVAMNICDLKLCKARSHPINETCVAKRKAYLGRGKAIVHKFKLH